MAVHTIAALNVIVFLLWLGGAPPDLMAAHFLVSGPHLEAGHVWTLLTSVFSHYVGFHLLVNMVVLLSFGPPVERLLGTREFVAFYLIAGAVASMAHVLVSHYLLDRPVPALGASGALAAVLLFFALGFPKARVLLFFIIPLPALVAALAFVAIDLWGLWAQVEGQGLPIGHGAHLGGAAFGALYFAARGRALLHARRAELPPP
jgi:membrane associated rhomboid family serine protease